MKVKELLRVLEAMPPDSKVLCSQGDYSAEVIVAEPQLFCRHENGYWVKCLVTNCSREKLYGVFII